MIQVHFIQRGVEQWIDVNVQSTPLYTWDIARFAYSIFFIFFYLFRILNY